MVEILKIAYATSWKSGKTSWQRKVRKSSSICPKLVDGSVCRNLPDESANTGQNYLIYRTNDVIHGGSETERPRCFWIHMILRRNNLLAVNNDGMTFKQHDCALNDCWYVSKVSVNRASTILVWSFRQSKGCIVTSIQRGVIGRL